MGELRRKAVKTVVNDYLAVLQQVVRVRQFNKWKVKGVGVGPLAGVVVSKVEHRVAVAEQVKQVVDAGPVKLDNRKLLEAVVHHYQPQFGKPVKATAASKRSAACRCWLCLVPQL